jgi:6-pyruvoyltetrahydropterin/6-carboxytetrahydropterin synthase
MESASHDIAIVRHQFDFSASHRLHVPTMSEEENRAVFGKCNNPSGHGHNYRLELALEVSTSPADLPPTLPDIERLTQEAVISRFDHKYLNIDTDEFGPHGVIPSVENISRVCYELLDAAMRQAFPDTRLRCVTVWETDRTSSTFPAR